MNQNNKLNILFISHSYPPIMGGVEGQNYNLAEGLKKVANVSIIANGKGKLWLPIFIPVTFCRSLFLMPKHDYCLVGNGVLSPLAFALKFFSPQKKFFSVVHGLDITFALKKGFLSKVYKFVNIPCLKKLDKLFMVGNYTIEVAVQAGIPKEKCVFIPNGVPSDGLNEVHSREELSNLLGFDTKDKRVILRLARFVPHKGTSWFIKNIMPQLPEDVIFIAVGHRVAKNTAGDPDNFLECKKYITDYTLEKRVKLLTSVSQDDLKILLNTVDLVVSPNIVYPGSVEGFGINVIEAAICERVVLASRIQGLADAIHDGQNGFLLDSGNIDQWIKTTKEFIEKDCKTRLEIGKKSADFTRKNFSWEEVVLRYLEEMKGTEVV